MKPLRFTETQLATLREKVSLREAIERDQVKLARKGKEWLGLCPFHTERTPSFYVLPNEQQFFCFGCGAKGDVITYTMRRRNLSFRQAVIGLGAGQLPELDEAELKRRDAERAKREAEALKWRIKAARGIFFGSAERIEETEAEAYLLARDIRRPASGWPKVLRFNPSLKLKGASEDEDRMLPALVAAVTNLENYVTAVHRIYLGPESTKTGKAEEKMLLGATDGGAVRLTRAGPDMLTCEGIETGLAIRQALPERPLWSGIDTSHMAAVRWPELVERLTIAADRDPVSEKPGIMQGKRPGEFWARATAERFIGSRAGREAAIAVPEGDKVDFNDLLQRGAA